MHEVPPTVRSPARRGNRRRVWVFAASFILLLAISLAFVFARPAEYRSSARVQITPATLTASKEAGPAPITAEVQVLTSRPVLETVAQTLQQDGYSLAIFGPEPVSGMQARLRASAIPNSDIVEVAATGGDRQVLAPLVNGIIDAYKSRIEEAYATNFEQAMQALLQETERLGQSVSDKRHAVERFRSLHNIVSLDRDENQILARVRSQNAALNAATERVAAAETKLRDITEASAAGKPLNRPHDEAAISSLQQQISQSWQELAQLDRRYTPEYLAKDPNVKLTRAHLADMESQLARLREQSKRGALVDAEAELVSAKAAKQRLESQVGSERNEVTQFTRYFNEYKAQQQELAQLEASYRDALQRKTTMQASEGSRQPRIKIVEAAVMPYEPWKPDYWRDAGIAATASLVIALMLAFGVDLFNRTDPHPAVVIAQRITPEPQNPGPYPLPNFQPMRLSGQQVDALPAPEAIARELGPTEVVRLVEAADPDTRLIVALLMTGLSEDEAIALRWSDVDLDKQVIQIRGKAARDIAFGKSLHDQLTTRSGDPDHRVLEFDGKPETVENMNAQLLCAAYDAGIEEPASVTIDALRHTYIAFLVRQGIRFIDLRSIVGDLSRSQLAAYSSIGSPQTRVAGAEITTEFPLVA